MIHISGGKFLRAIEKVRGALNNRHTSGISTSVIVCTGPLAISEVRQRRHGGAVGELDATVDSNINGSGSNWSRWRASGQQQEKERNDQNGRERVPHELLLNFIWESFLTTRPA
ncbi:MAG: hypothetical protein COU63_02080 [Candidatus Pacebacteria bacterium CG10_big_fil_rev_8_21_14_0_10_36_11]|nr:MAG: hypothetical protein AUK08_03645 [Candidatus Pacebacteria bacterium CG2_30_36_39]PIR64784.1 MAG: hypothetical protein COU63_02080 [Candidatus Pacebacteria bacterium CG10_big_fil_rev_8_21_14_0_10_36_11]PJC43139.1 MAG: hypothetical protein CO040_00775 [Candidatus Pacebacteria bacterium CG_4_9_14_0_2_um_filter_36_8]